MKDKETETEACPCKHTEPCHPRCTCIHGASSHGCRRCCTYGSPEQQHAKAKRLAAAIDSATRPLANNLCPDHRDKQKGKPCLACEIERLTAQLEEARSALNRIATESQGLRLRYFSRSSGEVVPPLIEDVANKALAAMQQKEGK